MAENSSSLSEISLYFPSFAIIRSFRKLIVKRKMSRAELIPEQYGVASWEGANCSLINLQNQGIKKSLNISIKIFLCEKEAPL